MSHEKPRLHQCRAIPSITRKLALLPRRILYHHENMCRITLVTTPVFSGGRNRSISPSGPHPPPTPPVWPCDGAWWLCTLFLVGWVFCSLVLGDLCLCCCCLLLVCLRSCGAGCVSVSCSPGVPAVLWSVCCCCSRLEYMMVHVVAMGSCADLRELENIARTSF